MTAEGHRWQWQLRAVSQYACLNFIFGLLPFVQVRVKYEMTIEQKNIRLLRRLWQITSQEGEKSRFRVILLSLRWWVGYTIPSLVNMRSAHCLQRTQEIIKDTSPPDHPMFQLLSSGNVIGQSKQKQTDSSTVSIQQQLLPLTHYALQWGDRAM